MRVITGTARGRGLRAPQGDDTRPTSAVVKEAVFSIVQFEVEGARALDLFAGSGQMGIEALSRGARSCALVDSGKRAVEIIRQNLEHTGLGAAAKVYQSDALAFLARTRLEFDIAFLDPPYAAGVLKKALARTEERMSARGVMVCECPAGAEMPGEVGRFSLARSYRYGKTGVCVYRAASQEE